MLDTVQTSYITTRKTYLLTCSACGKCREFQGSELPHTAEPHIYQCPCGQDSQVRLVGFRRAPRRAVALNGVLAVSTLNGIRRLLFRVEDLSVSGVRLHTEPVRHVEPPIQILLGLPGAVRQTLQASCQIKRSNLKEQRLQLALEFEALTPEQEEALASFLASGPS